MTPISHHVVNHRLPAPRGRVTDDRVRGGGSAREGGRPTHPDRTPDGHRR